MGARKLGFHTFLMYLGYFGRGSLTLAFAFLRDAAMGISSHHSPWENEAFNPGRGPGGHIHSASHEIVNWYISFPELWIL